MYLSPGCKWSRCPARPRTQWIESPPKIRVSAQQFRYVLIPLRDSCVPTRSEPANCVNAQGAYNVLSEIKRKRECQRGEKIGGGVMQPLPHNETWCLCCSRSPYSEEGLKMYLRKAKMHFAETVAAARWCKCPPSDTADDNVCSPPIIRHKDGL